MKPSEHNQEIHITYYDRQPMSTNFSIERVFQDVRKALPSTVYLRVVTSRFTSQGVLKRLYNICAAPFFQGDINHITGDVHYLTYLLKKKRTLLTIHDCVSLNRLAGWRKKLLFFFWYWLPEKRCQLISVISESTRQELLQYLPHAAKKIRIVHDPVSRDFKPNTKVFDASHPTLLQVGTGTNKNLIRVAKALNGIDCHLRIIGKLLPEQQAVLQYNGIEYSSAAHISDSQLAQEYCDADMVVFASTYEGFGLPILEAQATGRPVVTSNLMSMPEVAGEAACFVDPFDADSIRRGVLQIIEDEAYREELVIRGFQNIERFRPEVIAQQYVALYHEILKQKDNKATMNQPINI